MEIQKLVFWLQNEPLIEHIVKIQPGEIFQYYEKTACLKWVYCSVQMVKPATFCVYILFRSFNLLYWCCFILSICLLMYSPSYIKILCLGSFITEPASVNLNASLGITGKRSDPQVSATEAMDKDNLCFGIPNTKSCSQMNSGFLKGLKYNGGSYTAFLSPVWHPLVCNTFWVNYKLSSVFCCNTSLPL